MRQGPVVVDGVSRPPSPNSRKPGFGCATTPADTVLLLGILASPFLLLAGAIAMAAIAVRQATRREPVVVKDL